MSLSRKGERKKTSLHIFANFKHPHFIWMRVTLEFSHGFNAKKAWPLCQKCDKWHSDLWNGPEWNCVYMWFWNILLPFSHAICPHSLWTQRPGLPWKRYTMSVKDMICYWYNYTGICAGGAAVLLVINVFCTSAANCASQAAKCFNQKACLCWHNCPHTEVG